jgi:Zn-dependent membrane protease YugP
MKSFLIRLISFVFLVVLGIAVLVGTLLFKFVTLPLSICVFAGTMFYLLFVKKTQASSKLVSEELKMAANL